MRVKMICDEWFQDYKFPAMFIGTISCGGKCCVEAGLPLSVCHNDRWRTHPPYEIPDKDICERYLKDGITTAIIIGGLEPFEQFHEVCALINTLRNTYHCNDTVIIYTGYNREEVEPQIKWLSGYQNIIVKFGRYIPNRQSVFDDVLGVELASDNQHAERIS